MLCNAYNSSSRERGLMEKSFQSAYTSHILSTHTVCIGGG